MPEARDLPDEEFANLMCTLPAKIDAIDKRGQIHRDVKIEACVLRDTVSALARPKDQIF